VKHLLATDGLDPAFATAVLVLLGFPPFAMFASELSIARGLADAHLAWPLGIALVLMLVAFAAIAYSSSLARSLTPTPNSDTRALRISFTQKFTSAVLAGRWRTWR